MRGWTYRNTTMSKTPRKKRKSCFLVSSFWWGKSVLSVHKSLVNLSFVLSPPIIINWTRNYSYFFFASGVVNPLYIQWICVQFSGFDLQLFEILSLADQTQSIWHGIARWVTSLCSVRQFTFNHRQGLYRVQGPDSLGGSWLFLKTDNKKKWKKRYVEGGWKGKQREI